MQTVGNVDAVRGLSSGVRQYECWLPIAGRLQLGSHFDSDIVIHRQQSCRRSSDGIQSHDHRAFQVEALVPQIGSRIEQRNQLLCVRIDGRQIGAFVAIAVRTGESQIVECIVPAMLRRANMLDVEAQKRRGGLRQVAVLAPMVCSLSHALTSGGVHCQAADWSSKRRARACMIVTK